jgi:heat shock protein HtpX
MFDSTIKNKRKTTFIVLGFTIFVGLIVYALVYLFSEGSMFAFTFAMIAAILSSIGAYYNCDKIVLRMNKARPATEEEFKKLNNILDALMVSSGMQFRPKLYVMDDYQPNAFATGRDPEHSVICVTTALLDRLDYYELEGVLAHELSHIANYDIRLSAIVTVMVGVIVMLSDMFTRTFLYRDNDSDSDSKGNGIIMLIGLICLIISPIFAKLMQLAVSRRREYLADATAVQFTRNPDGLISALIKISEDPNELTNASKSTAHMYISSPFRSKKTNLYKCFITFKTS